MKTNKKQKVLDILNNFKEQELMGECLGIEGVDETPVQTIERTPEDVEKFHADMRRIQDGLDEQKIKRVLRATAPACVKRIALNYARSNRAHPFKRVSQSFLDDVESNALNFIKNRVDRHPSRGVTLM